MQKQEIKKRIEEIALIPVIRAASADMALRATEAIRDGGVPIVEITMTVPGAVNLIEKVSARLGNEVLVGAGTVLTPENAIECIDAGAQFIVSPALNLATIAAVRERQKVICPGALTPTEVITAWQAGADYVKVFPCGNVGGAKYIRALKAPFPYVKLIPTGGVSLSTAADFLAAGCSALGVGADLVDAEAMKRGDYATLTRNAQAFLEIVSKRQIGAAARV